MEIKFIRRFYLLGTMVVYHFNISCHNVNGSALILYHRETLFTIHSFGMDRLAPKMNIQIWKKEKPNQIKTGNIVNVNTHLDAKCVSKTLKSIAQ